MRSFIRLWNSYLTLSDKKDISAKEYPAGIFYKVPAGYSFALSPYLECPLPVSVLIGEVVFITELFFENPEDRIQNMIAVNSDIRLFLGIIADVYSQDHHFAGFFSLLFLCGKQNNVGFAVIFDQIEKFEIHISAVFRLKSHDIGGIDGGIAGEDIVIRKTGFVHFHKVFSSPYVFYG